MKCSVHEFLMNLRLSWVKLGYFSALLLSLSLQKIVDPRSLCKKPNDDEPRFLIEKF